MSRKIDAFRIAVPQPLTKKDITMLCPALVEGAFLAQAMSFPSESMQEVVYYYQGRPLYTPTRTMVPGDWTVDLPESVAVLMRRRLSRLMYAKLPFDVSLIPSDLTSVLSSAISLDIGGLLKSAASSTVAALLAGIKLGNAWVKTIAPVDFSASGATEPVIWRASIRYDYIKPLINWPLTIGGVDIL